MGLQKFWVEISDQANSALVEDARVNKRSRKKQAEYLIEDTYRPAASVSVSDESQNGSARNGSAKRARKASRRATSHL